jgi:hypothetical protein
VLWPSRVTAGRSTSRELLPSCARSADAGVADAQRRTDISAAPGGERVRAQLLAPPRTTGSAHRAAIASLEKDLLLAPNVAPRRPARPLSGRWRRSASKIELAGTGTHSPNARRRACPHGGRRRSRPTARAAARRARLMERFSSLRWSGRRPRAHGPLTRRGISPTPRGPPPHRARRGWKGGATRQPGRGRGPPRASGAVWPSATGRGG